MIVGRLIGWALLLATLGLLGVDSYGYAGSGTWKSASLAESLIGWGLLEPVQIDLLQSALQRNSGVGIPELWTHVVQPGLLLPAWLWTVGLGIILLLLFRTRR